MAFIYALSDPRNPRLAVYVGRTTRALRRRLSSLVSKAKRKPDAQRVNRWILGLIERGTLPIIYALEEVDPSEMVNRETHWIRFLKPLGTLLNESDGPGLLGMVRGPMPKEQRDKLYMANTGKHMSDTQRSHWMDKIAPVAHEAAKRANSVPVETRCGEYYTSITEAANAYGVSKTAVFQSINRGTKCSGKHFSYSPVTQ